MLNKPLIAALLLALGVGLLVAWTKSGTAQHLAVGRPSARGATSSQSRWAFLPFQLLLVSPVLAPVWIAGLVALLRRPALRGYRFLGAAWLVRGGLADRGG